MGIAETAAISDHAEDDMNGTDDAESIDNVDVVSEQERAEVVVGRSIVRYWPKVSV